MVLSYTIGAILAFLNYPLHYSPIKNWLSDLGNKELNPTGAIFYNAGILITSVWLILFFLSLSVLKTGKNRIRNLMILLTQFFGVIGSVAMTFSAFYTIDNPGVHSVLSAGLYIGLGTAFAFSAAALRYDPACPKWLLALGGLTALFDMLTSLFFSTKPVFEWITVSLFLGYTVLLVRTIHVLMKINPKKSNLSSASYVN